jgi:purine-binding chemotaxis protein CheW
MTARRNQILKSPTDSLAGRSEGESGRTRQLVCFRIGEETYGLDIRSVREIRAWSATTLLPNVPDFVRGVLNLRGTVVPILDLRARFGWGQTEATGIHVVIVIAVDSRLVGILVDAVSDILTVPETDIRPVPEVGNAKAHECLDGLVTQGEQLIALVSGERIVAPVSVH